MKLLHFSPFVATPHHAPTLAHYRWSTNPPLVLPFVVLKPNNILITETQNEMIEHIEYLYTYIYISHINHSQHIAVHLHIHIYVLLFIERCSLNTYKIGKDRTDLFSSIGNDIKLSILGILAVRLC